MLKGIVIRDDRFWQGHPDVAYFKGHFYVAYRQSSHHRALNNTQIMLVRSRNGTQFGDSICIASTENRYNCPRLKVIDDQLWMICDHVGLSEDFIQGENNEANTKVVLAFSADGTHWSAPFITIISGIVPDRICVVNDTFFIATHTTGDKKNLVQNVWKSRHLLSHQWEKITLAESPGLNLCEASLCPCEDQIICLMRENSQQGYPCHWSMSSDKGRTWLPPRQTRMFGGHRPVLGQLSSGNFLTTYREQNCPHSPRYWAKNTFACLTTPQSMLNPMSPCSRSIILPLDHDNGFKSDSGYTGWIETEDGQIYVVNYITNKAPQPYIVWYLLDESEF